MQTQLDSDSLWIAVFVAGFVLLVILACLDLMTRTAMSARAVGEMLKKDGSTISRSVACVQKLPPDIHELLRRGALSADAATPLMTLSSDDEKHRWASLFTEGQVTRGQELAEAIRAARNGAAAAARKAADLQAAEDALANHAGTH